MATRRYLLVDDNRPLAENLAEILRERGDDVVVVDNGQDALECVQKERFDAVVTDMRMPGMNGAELIQALRKVDAGLPAVLITAFTHDATLAKARQQGLLAILNKPVPIARMLDLLEVAQRDAYVALVEDDEALLDNLTEALRAKGWTALTATSLQETQQLALLKPFAALVDLKVPGGQVGDALPILKSRFPGVPVVVMTAHSEVLPQSHTHVVFSKPFQTEKLLATLDTLRPGVAA